MCTKDGKAADKVERCGPDYFTVLVLLVGAVRPKPERIGNEQEAGRPAHGQGNGKALAPYRHEFVAADHVSGCQ